MRSAHISIFDTKLRDGEQAAGCSMTSTQKLRLARQLDALGVDIIEAGFAIVSEDDASAISAIAAEVKRPTIASLARANKRDIEAAARALENAAKPRIHIVLAASDLHLEHELRMTRQALNLAGESVSHARNFVDEVQ
jgi:2-isopropylmalate synthase